MRYDAIMVGGGIVGASVAYHLARDGVDALLVYCAIDDWATDTDIPAFRVEGFE